MKDKIYFHFAFTCPEDKIMVGISLKIDMDNFDKKDTPNSPNLWDSMHREFGDILDKIARELQR